jgi:hypothetical protein
MKNEGKLQISGKFMISLSCLSSLSFTIAQFEIDYDVAIEEK